ncbi:tyrosine kinase receptor Cad96Ca-like isoform X2 [Zootermopsis nevadensis]|uniref:tyrosine kinase receptor Cad96Ca-like isoform X2 n=1 Tax=Zootermopsis nevadensis TaxID=136037 RepID=UPI000B8E72AF|nr:tyrosine kinase receptor Cad96Ca-like isoform X2 [Zootermopsis nevadensis]
MGPNCEFLWIIPLLQLCGVALGQLTDNNTPPVVYLDRNWVVHDTDPVGEVIARVNAEDPEKDRLEYGLEAKGYNGAGSPDRPLPFAINSTTGVVKINESLVNRGGEQLFLYVTVFDGQVTSKTEVWARIRSSSATPDSTEINNERPPPGATAYLPNSHFQFPGGGSSGGSNIPPGFIQPPPPRPEINRKPRPPPPPPPPPQTTQRAATVQEHARVQTTETALTPLPGGGSPHHNTTNAEGTVTSVPDLTATLIPISVVCGLFITGGAAAWLFRRKFCRYRNKGNKDDMHKESSGGIGLEEPMVLQQWQGPRAHSNRYEGWDRDSNLQQTPGPGNTKSEDRWEFPRHHLKVFNILGEGCFGQVWRCEALDLNGREGTTVVAVKTLKENASDKERSDLVQELQVMKMLEPHPNVVRLLGCCTEKEPLFVIMEYVPHGKLQSFLRNSRAERYYGNLHGASNTLTSRDLTSFVYQVARGMDFLSSKGIIHRDLAARNILVGENHICKVADFGFARDIISSHVYERKSEGRLPIRWMAPESLYDNIFSVKSDVWSFGVLIWEIVTLGSTPYPGLAAAEVMRRVRDGYRLDKPEHCRRELYNIMYYCWDKDPKERPSFSELIKLLEQLLLTETEYIELERFPDHSYYNMVSLSDEKL